MKVAINKSIRDEKGQALILVLVLMVVGGLIIAPLLSYMSTGLIAGRVYEEIADELYAADAGVEDGLWQIKYNRLSGLFSDYDLYDYGAVYNYPTGYPLEVNDIDVDVTIENVWIPLPGDIPVPDSAEEIKIAKDIIGAGKLIITDSVPAELTQQIKIYYYKETEPPYLEVTKLGIWLPPGFSYDTGGVCNLETWLDASGKAYSRATNPHCGGEAVVWTFSSVLFTDLPGVDTKDFPMTSTITFKFTSSQPGRSPEAVSWITTSGVSDIPYTWDADVKVYHIVSQAGGEDGTTVEAYAVKSEMRELGSAISGDYRAIGATLMTDKHPSSPPIRDTLLDESDATADDIPDNAYVEAAWLYWSAWLASGTAEDILFWDDCSNFSDWANPGSDWGLSMGRFRGHHLGSEAHRYLTMQDSIDLSLCSPGAVTVSWQQDASWWVGDNDCLKFQFHNGTEGWSELITAFCDDNPPNTFSYIIPDEYLTEDFSMAFYLDGFSGWGEYAYIDNIKISVQLETIADISAIFEINGTQVYFVLDEEGNQVLDGDGNPVVAEGDEEIIAKEWSVLENKPGEYSYACYLDVTRLVQVFSDHGNGTYTVGDVYGDTDNEWSYAAWSLIIIYSSPQTKGHQLYLYDDFTYVDNDETLEFPISGFLVPEPIAGEVNAATLTCFVGEGDDYYDWDYLEFNGTALSDGKSTDDVWNSWSYGLAEDGIDIDTFYVTWDSDLLEPGDTSAQVDLPTATDSWNLVYIILSFRSETTTGGTITYLVRG